MPIRNIILPGVAVKLNTTDPSYKKLFWFFLLLVALAWLVRDSYFWLSQQGVLYQSVPVPALPVVEGGVPADIVLATPTPFNSNLNIYIKSLDINAPVTKNVDGSRKEEYLPNVLQGVAHYQHKELPDVTVDGALPGESGNIFLFGHSQIPGGDLSNFKGVFNRLPEIKIGERTQILYQGQPFDYEVYEAKVISKSEISYLEKTPQETLTLMTCWPLGLDIKRFVVRAKRVP